MKLLALIILLGTLSVAFSHDTPQPHDLPQIPAKNRYVTAQNQTRRIYQVVDVKKADFPDKFIPVIVQWRKNYSTEALAYKIHVKYDGVINHIYITRNGEQEIFLPRAKTVEIWVTAYNSVWRESTKSKSIFVKGGKEI